MIKSKLKIYAISIILSGCSAPDMANNKHTPLLPLNNEQIVISMDDGYVKQAISEYFKYKKAPLFSQYNFIRKDLNNDGLEDAIVYINTPYGYWCNAHGCTVLIMKAHNQGLSIVGEIKSVRQPFSIEKSRTNGWNDISFYISGRKEKAYTARLSFNGSQYTMDLDNESLDPVY